MENKPSKPQIFRYTLALFSLLLLFACHAPSSAIAQEYSSDDKKAVKYFSEARTAYRELRLDEAKELAEKSLEEDANFAEAQALIAFILIDQGDYDAAEANFKKAVELDKTGLMPNNIFFLAQLILNDGRYEEAKGYFEKYLAAESRNERMNEESRRQLDQIDFAIEAVANPVDFKPENLGAAVNSEMSEYFPSLTVDENTILFTRRLPSNSAPEGFNEDFYMAHKENEEWQTAYNIEKPINTEMNEGAPSLSADGLLLIFTACELYNNYGGNRQGMGSCDLFYSQKRGKNWGIPYNLGQTINSRHWETQPSFSADGRTLYFIRGLRDQSGTMNGNIYVSQLDKDLRWSKPVPLSKKINTPYNEESVFIHPDGQTLYFSSDGHPGLGGLDIFISRKDPEGNWGEPVNLGYPINTHKNENSLLVSSDGKTAYFASDRDEGYGELDLYKFELDEKFAPQKVSYFAGVIYDSNTDQPLEARFQLIDLATSKLVVESYSDEMTGEFLVTLPAGKEYALNVSKDGYLFYSANFALEESSALEPRKENIPLEPIEIGKKIVLKNIFFETDKYKLKDKSKVELNKLIEFLTDNPGLKIKVMGHTDNVGSDAYNKTLSQNRAKSVVEYLSNNGISADRIQSEGYGSKQPIADNATAEGRAKNRRTEFQITGM
ncbi:MAG: hypothetical protein CMP59_13315 [Flavobacteriales bacterium]|nr:hypothetical protein [Flavobacteriales bacterium]|tara:strand:+ start:1169 stop:3160 length:1992 start_codon:yes stop_codon:yes gene_type:complete